MKRRAVLRAFFSTVFFNFRYLPFKQALKLPIWVYKPHFLSLKGTVSIEAEKVYPGMIRLGFHQEDVPYPNSGFSWTHQGHITFKGKCLIGNNAFIVTGMEGKIEFGDDFQATSSLKIVSRIGIKFGKSISIGWEVIVMDTNFHPVYDMEKKQFKKAYGEIVIGDNNWVANQCCILHSVRTPKCCIFAARSILTKGGKYESYCTHGGNPIKILSQNVLHDSKKGLDYHKIDD